MNLYFTEGVFQGARLSRSMCRTSAPSVLSILAIDLKSSVSKPHVRKQIDGQSDDPLVTAHLGIPVTDLDHNMGHLTQGRSHIHKLDIPGCLGLLTKVGIL